MSKMMKFYIEVFVVMGMALSGPIKWLSVVIWARLFKAWLA